MMKLLNVRCLRRISEDFEVKNKALVKGSVEIDQHLPRCIA